MIFYILTEDYYGKFKYTTASTIDKCSGWTSGADIAARVGYPSVTIPAGYTKSSKPVGLTFTSISFTEENLLFYAYAYAYECAYNKRKNPQQRGILNE
jgi:Asp-tRNA(Asn)/Glu-tRNA(Gln) amidotransferase A subunit family amidase